MSSNADPTQKDPERAFALQKYLLLHSQHDALQRHLEYVITSLPVTANSSPEHSPSYEVDPLFCPSNLEDSADVCPSPTPAMNPYQRHRSGSVPHVRSAVGRRASLLLPTLVDESIIEEIQEDETKLKNVNHQIKSTLTQLLNCDSVKGDRRYRMWVQTRLMDAEMELKADRTRARERRRSEDASGMMSC